MRNFIFISPNFPTNYWKFCKELKNNGFNVLGVGDCPYDELMPCVKDSLNDYYKVDWMEDYEQVYRAVAFFIFKYGKIEFIESNNEYWLERDAYLRTDFNVTTGFVASDVDGIKHKSKMKSFYEKAGIPVARYCLVTDEDTCKKFIGEVGYPVIVKPDNGVGANGTFKLTNDEDLNRFLHQKPDVSYIMEEFIDAEVNSYDAIIDGNGEPIFETGNVTPNSIMDIVNNNDNSIYYIVNKPFEDVKIAGRKMVKAFGVKNRFIHFEFFRLLSDQHIGKKGDVVALEVNMRPAGGFSPDMMNYANSVDVYKIWADVLAYGSTKVEIGERFYCGYAGRRDGKNFVFDDEYIIEKYSDRLKAIDRIPDALAPAMGNMMYLANFKTKKELNDFYSDVLKVKK